MLIALNQQKKIIVDRYFIGMNMISISNIIYIILYFFEPTISKYKEIPNIKINVIY